MANNKLIKEWRSLYESLKDDVEWHEYIQEQDFESLCFGWCIAKGLTFTEAYEFYQEMIKLNLY